MEGFAAVSQAAQSLETKELPHGPDFHYYTNNPSFKSRVDAVASEAMAVLQLLPAPEAAAPGSRFASEDAADALGSQLDYLYGALDDALASARSVPAAAPGAEVISGAQGAGEAAQRVAGKRAGQEQEIAAQSDRLLAKPQLAFEDGVDNSNEPWRPKYDGLPGEAASLSARAAEALARGEAPAHPLAATLDALSYAPWQLEVTGTPAMPAGFEQVPYEYVATPAALRALAARLEAAREIAVDLEAHSYRSYQGFTCLMQLSTRSADYLVDVLALRSSIGPVLGPIFADPSRVKVLHGADSDIVWLQRDFGIYLANLFDTGQAARVLRYPGHGLAYLLDRFCGFQADKRLQLADWRRRPLSAEMERYARADTHFLLYVYDMLRLELLALAPEAVPEPLRVLDAPAAPPLRTVLERSRRLCLLRYAKDVRTPTTFLASATRLDPPLLDAELAAYRALFDWRDALARAEDESTGWVLPRAQLLMLARALPTTATELKAVVGHKARGVLAHARAILDLLRSAGADHCVREAAALRREFLANAHVGSPRPDFASAGAPRAAPPPKCCNAARRRATQQAPAQASASPAAAPPDAGPSRLNSAARPSKPRALKPTLPLAGAASLAHAPAPAGGASDNWPTTDPAPVAPPAAPGTSPAPSASPARPTSADAAAFPALGSPEALSAPRRKRVAAPLRLAATSQVFGAAPGAGAAPSSADAISQVHATLSLPFVSAAEPVLGEPGEEEGAREPGSPAASPALEPAPVGTSAEDVRAAMDAMRSSSAAPRAQADLDSEEYVALPEDRPVETQRGRKGVRIPAQAPARQPRAGQAQKKFEPFDYSAALRRPGVSALPPTGGVPDASASGPKRGQPRGGKAGGRRPGGKGQAGATEGAYNPFKIKDASIKRGKRSSTVTMKSGNRSTYF
ncbi:hypothetical protein QBZ16_005278 [Prototheca wickerhamii]|uniref:HRDC domain-containing protein n=1 Tax=Prototheca wickerhamii TaxID=3111 RepID=A0AAD9IH03_PROWI|nr:hypothetical protein QBZ16_005278 [Prototheca wickerhamii]